MGTKSMYIGFAVATIVLLLSGCGPNIFRANFNQDIVGNTPAVYPPGAPSGDEINWFCGPGTGGLDITKVIYSSVLNSKALRFYHTPGCSIPRVWFDSTQIDPSNSFLTFAFNAYLESTDLNIFYLNFDYFSGAIFSVSFDQGTIYLIENKGSGDYPKKIIGTYAANQKQTFLVGINRVTNTYNLNIIRPQAVTIKLHNMPIYRSVWGNDHYSFSVASDDENNAASNTQGFVIDQITISKEKK